MKLFLSSLAISDSQSVELARLIGKEPSTISLALIENAADTYGEAERAWVYINRAAIQSHGFAVELVDLREYNKRPALIKAMLRTKDIVWFGGGNSFYLRWLLKDTGIDAILKELVVKGLVYGGGSAGAIIAGPTLKHFELPMILMMLQRLYMAAWPSLRRWWCRMPTTPNLHQSSQASLPSCKLTVTK